MERAVPQAATNVAQACLRLRRNALDDAATGTVALPGFDTPAPTSTPRPAATATPQPEPAGTPRTSFVIVALGLAGSTDAADMVTEMNRRAPVETERALVDIGTEMCAVIPDADGSAAYVEGVALRVAFDWSAVQPSAYDVATFHEVVLAAMAAGCPGAIGALR